MTQISLESIEKKMKEDLEPIKNAFLTAFSRSEYALIQEQRSIFQCPNCNDSIPKNVKFCPSCGSQIDAEIFEVLKPKHSDIETIYETQLSKITTLKIGRYGSFRSQLYRKFPTIRDIIESKDGALRNTLAGCGIVKEREVREIVGEYISNFSVI